MLDAEKIANEHWEWLEKVLRQIPSCALNIPLPFGLLKVLYITAFIHGWKHAKEE